MIDPIELLKRYWQPLAIVLIIGVCIARCQYYKSSYERTAQEYASFKTELFTQSALQKQKNAIIEANTAKSIGMLITKHRDEVLAINADRSQLSKTLKDEYAIKTLNDYKLSSLHDRLSIDSTSGATLPITATDTERLAECRSERDAANTRLSNVEEACAITTSDYNLARGWIDTVYDNYGGKN